MNLSKRLFDKQSRKLILLRNVQRGKLAEEDAIEDLKQHGLAPISTGIGSDVKTLAPDEEYWEIKSGNSRLSKKQKSTKIKLKKAGKKYNVYRVSNHRLDYLLEQKALKELKKIPTFQESYDLNTFSSKFIITDPTDCPNCRKVAMDAVTIFEIFGFRTMGDGTVRVQSWCKLCRKQSKRRIKN